MTNRAFPKKVGNYRINGCVLITMPDYSTNDQELGSNVCEHNKETSKWYWIIKFIKSQ